MRFDIARRHPFRIHGQNLFLDIPADAGLMFFNRLRLKFTFSVSGNSYFYISETGSQHFLTVSVPAVIRLFVPIVVLAVANFTVISYCFSYSVIERTCSVLLQFFFPVLPQLHGSRQTQKYMFSASAPCRRDVQQQSSYLLTDILKHRISAVHPIPWNNPA